MGGKIHKNHSNLFLSNFLSSPQGSWSRGSRSGLEGGFILILFVWGTYISTYWLIGFTEAEGSFYIVSKEPTRIVHAFEITQKLNIIVLQAIGHILGIKLSKKKTHYTVVTTNSRSIYNIIEYYSNTMKGIKVVEFRIWARSFVKHKGNFSKLHKIRKKIRLLRQIRLDKNFHLVKS